VELSAASMSEAGKSWLGPARKGKRGGGPVRAMPAAARERWRRVSGRRCLTLCGSRGAGGARGLHASTWAGRG
jgi:hypothetical protein